MVARIETRLKQILVAEGRSQSWLGRAVGVNRVQINRYANGLHEPGLEMKCAIADALGRELEDVFPNSEEIAA